MGNSRYYLYDLICKKRIDLRDGLVFGREASCDIQVPDKAVSSCHFKIHIIDQEVYITDLNSSNKTFVNESPIKPTVQVKLSFEDIIKVGEYEYSLLSEEAKKLDLPSQSRTLVFDRSMLDQLDDIDTDEEEPEEIDMDNVKVFPTPAPAPASKQTVRIDLKVLLENKKQIDELISQREKTLENIESLKRMRREKIEKGARIDRFTETIKSFEHKDKKSFEANLRIHRGTVEGFKLKINKELNEIKKARAIIAKAEEAIMQANFNISKHEGEKKYHEDLYKKVNREFSMFNNRNTLEAELIVLRNKIKEFEKINLEKEKVDLDKKINEKTKEYRKMQDEYGERITSGVKSKKASS